MPKNKSKAAPEARVDAPDAPITDRLLTEAETAQHLNCTKRCLQAWRLRGGGPEFVKVGRLVRYRPQAIDNFEAANTHTTTSDPGPDG